MAQHPAAAKSRTPVSQLRLIGGLLILLTAAATACSDAEPTSPVKQEASTPAGASPTEAAQAVLPSAATWVLIR